jgi:hypothetical protein
MPSNSTSVENNIAAEEPLPLQKAASSTHVTEMQDGHSRKPEASQSAKSGGDVLLQKIACELYRIASMLLGEGEEAIDLTERVVTNVDLPTCCNDSKSRQKARLLLAADAISILGKRDSAALAAPADDSGPTGCIEEDDLSAAGVTPDELEQMITGPSGNRLRDWLEGLAVSLRVIFVLRAIAAISSVEVAGLLAKHGGSQAAGWTPDAVRASFRQALCSLASQLIHLTAAR